MTYLIGQPCWIDVSVPTTAEREDLSGFLTGLFGWTFADLGDGRSVEAALLDFRAEAVLHSGAATDVDGCERDPARAWRVNVGGTEQAAPQGEAAPDQQKPNDKVVDAEFEEVDPKKKKG